MLYFVLFYCFFWLYIAFQALNFTVRLEESEQALSDKSIAKRFNYACC